ncbi:MAG: hypothetical protein IJY39_08855 [Clostridia bacterium]|nr:hypothetical protein [Clostridia bacterium]
MLFFGAIASMAFLLFLLRSDIAIEYMKKGLKLCAYTVIPSLFPFMVISELIISSGVGQKLGRVLARPIGWLFGVSESGACAFVLGAICGFPIGARTLCTMQDRGLISQKELERVLTFCNNPGSAFVISAVGVALFGSRELGVMLYTCVLLSAVTVGVAGRLFFKKDVGTEKAARRVNPQPSHTGVYLFTSAIQGSASSMLTVCSYVAFFSSFVGCLGAILSSCRLSDAALSSIFGFFELSSGVGVAANVSSPTAAILLCSAFLGWSGLSVHAQIITICAGRGISFKPYFIAKAAQGLICAVLMGIFLKLFPISEKAFAQMQQTALHSAPYTNAAFVCIVFFAATILPLIFCTPLRALKNISKKQKYFSKRG